jgi:hypothetical protein
MADDRPTRVVLNAPSPDGEDAAAKPAVASSSTLKRQKTSPNVRKEITKLGKNNPLRNKIHFSGGSHHDISVLSFVSINVVIAMLIMVGIQFIAVAIWPKCTPGVPCKYRRSQLETFSDIVDERVPPLQSHASSADFSYLRSVPISQNTMGMRRDCVTPWMDVLKAQVGNASDPAIIQDIMGYLGLTNVESALEAIGTLGSQPQPFAADLERVASCTRHNAPVNSPPSRAS